MTTIVPAPHHTRATEGSTVNIDTSSWIDAGDHAALAADWLRRGLQTLAGVHLAETSATGPKISLRIGVVNELMPITTGVRADGGNPHCEGYKITIGDREITIEGMSPEAVFRGATSLIQKAALAAHSGTLALEAGTVIDAPRLAWRGLSLDVVRCFHPVSTVKKVIDLLALYKMNVLHLHLTDTEGWRYHVNAWPLLTEVSGQTARNDRSGGYYTPDEFAEIVQYASDHYITVVPEFDSPGHTASVLRAYPELAAEGITAMPDAMHYLHPAQPGVADLLTDVYSAMAEAVNGDRIHIGGDEAIAMEHATFQQYIELALPLARNTGKGIVAWQEAARGGLAEGDLMQLWIPPFLIEDIKRRMENPTAEDLERAKDPVVKAFVELFSTADEDLGKGLDAGADVIISLATQLYLDTKYIEESTDAAQRERQDRVGMRQDVYGQGTVEESYNWDPTTVMAELPVNRIAGVEAAIWCETIEGEDDLFFQLLPRLAGVAEKAWSDHREWDDYRARLAQQPQLWDAMGLTYFRSSVVWS